ncbi:hypothetical protein CDAR_547901 [Caerostris darwini]|uniref:Uncharacterized protein n=1 Tax=Caerostris darwini TaxID=1538125 RepID=A0AAV4WIF4_9ARAC|nr:hypothetical protein CDAR_547901 [Caerostris darwini]
MARRYLSRYNPPHPSVSRRWNKNQIPPCCSGIVLTGPSLFLTLLPRNAIHNHLLYRSDTCPLTLAGFPRMGCRLEEYLPKSFETSFAVSFVKGLSNFKICIVF